MSTAEMVTGREADQVCQDCKWWVVSRCPEDSAARAKLHAARTGHTTARVL